MKECLTPSQYCKEQFGKAIDFNMVVENKNEFAKVFAEGSDALESLLLYLWDTGIPTKACCAGHVVKPVFVKQILWIKRMSQNMSIWNTATKNIINNYL